MASCTRRSQRQIIFAILAASYSGAVRVQVADVDHMTNPQDRVVASLSSAVQGRLAAEPASALVEETLNALQALAQEQSGIQHGGGAVNPMANGISQASTTAAVSSRQLAVAELARTFLAAHSFEDAEATFLGALTSDLFEDAIDQANKQAMMHQGATPIELQKTNSLLAGVAGAHENTLADQGVLPPTPLSRPCAKPKYFIWGNEYFLDIYNDFESLGDGDEIIIAGWLIELFTVNLLGDKATDESILSRTLRRAAERGVKIYVQFWYSHVSEVARITGKLFMGRDSYRVSQLHNNIHVLLDSGRGVSMSNLWSWHIKAVVIDRAVSTTERQTSAHVTGHDFKLTNWDTPHLLRPDPRRQKFSVSGHMNWIDVGVKVHGAVARDVRQALTSRHASCCSAKDNILARGRLLAQNFWFQYDQCAEEHHPAVNPRYLDAPAVGSCSLLKCNDEFSTTCVLGNCVCQDGYRTHQGTCVLDLPEKQDMRDDHALNSCRRLLTASSYRMDVAKDSPQILDSVIEAIKNADHSEVLDHQYFIGSRGGCDFTCPQNLVMETVAMKLHEKISNRKPFSFVLFLAGKSGNSHMPMLKTLFAEAPHTGLFTRVKRWCEEAGVKMSDYMVIATPMKMVNQSYLVKHGVPKDTSSLAYLGSDMPSKDEVSAYTVYDHSKAFVVDGHVAILGSANTNDRSLLGTMQSDAEMDIEVTGPSAKELLDLLVLRYTGLAGKGSLGQTEGLASLVHSVAMHNNDQMVKFLGINFAAGRWAVGELRGRRLFPGTQEEELCHVTLPERFSCADGTCETANRTFCQHHLMVSDSCVCQPGLCFDESLQACVKKPQSSEDELKRRSDQFAKWIAGEDAMIVRHRRPDLLDWRGIAAPLTNELWGPADDKYWVDFKNAWYDPWNNIVN